MGVKISDVPLSGLHSLQQATEIASREMYGLFQQIVEDHKKGLVSTSYFEMIEKKLKEKIKNNNEVCDIIEKETFKRLQSVFGNKVTTSKIMTSLVAEYEQEKKKHDKLYQKGNDKKDIIPLNTKVDS